MAIANLSVRLTAEIAEFRAQFAEAQKTTEKFQQGFQASATKAAAVGASFAIAATQAAGALINVGRSVLDNASKIEDLSQRTGLAMRTIQEFQHAAEQTGTTVDAFANAAFRLGANIAGNRDSVAQAVDDLGLSFQDLKRQRMDDQFNTVVDALGKMENAQEANRIALVLFDRTAGTVLGAARENYHKLREAATVASDAQIQALSAASNAYDAFARSVQTHTTAAVGSAVIAAQALKENFADVFSRFVAQGPAGGVQAVIGNVAQKFLDVELAAAKANLQNKNLGNTLAQQALDADKAAESGKRLAAALREQEAEARRLSSIRASFTGEDQIKAAQDVIRAFQGTIPLQNLSAESQQRLNTLFGEAIAVSERMGRTVPQAFRDIYDATLLPLAVVPQLPPAIEGITEAFARIGEISGVLEIPRRELEGLNLTVAEGQRLLESYLEVVAIAPSLFERMFGSWRTLGENLVGNLANAFNFTGDSLANIFKNFADTTAKQFAQVALSFIPGIGPLISQFAGPIVDGVKKLFGSIFDRNRGRDLVEDFAGSLGGFDALHRKLNELGAEGERLWIQLTQGVGRNNPDQARRAIEAVNAALAEQARKQQEAGRAAVETARDIREAQDAAATKVRGQIQTLTSEYDRLFQLVKDEVPEFDEHGNFLGMGVEEARIKGQLAEIDAQRKQAQTELDAIMQESGVEFVTTIDEGLQAAAEKFKASLGGFTFNPSSGSSPGHLPGWQEPPSGFGGRTPEQSILLPMDFAPEAGTSTAVIQMDGRTVAEASVPWIPDVVREYGLV